MQHSRQWVLLGAVVLLLGTALLAGCGGVDDVWIPPVDPPVDAAQLHLDVFTETSFTGTDQCLGCHPAIGDDILTTGHWNWKGVAANVEGHESESHGKSDFINNFCIANASNEGRCTACHIGSGWVSNTPASFFNDPSNIDCLCCHDQTQTYKKGFPGGYPDASLDQDAMDAIAQSVGQSSVPTRKACLNCHATAGGGDNVKHGDLSTKLVATTKPFDVHMGTDGQDFACVECHRFKKDSRGNVLSHGMGGMPFHSTDEGDMQGCTDCHTDPTAIHTGKPVGGIFNSHPTLDCRVCHIPTFARQRSTKTQWYWQDAGPENAPDPIPEYEDPDGTVRPLWNKLKGTFVYENDVRPYLLRHDGTWYRRILNENDQLAPGEGTGDRPAVLAAPAADPKGGGRIYPFKRMLGTQAADDVEGGQILVPHLYPYDADDTTAYWKFFDWDLALTEGADYTGQVYSGKYWFPLTVMYLSVNHEIAPKDQAYGFTGSCADCHGAAAGIDWDALGRTDPMAGS